MVARDPLERYRAWLAASGVADEAFFATSTTKPARWPRALARACSRPQPRPVEELFAWVFADLPPHLARQRDEVLGGPRRGTGADG